MRRTTTTARRCSEFAQPLRGRNMVVVGGIMSAHRTGKGEVETTGHGGIAIIGMACLFPGAPNLDTYWQNIVSKVDAITDPPPDAWDVNVFYDPNSTTNDRVYCKRGGFISPLTFF